MTPYRTVSWMIVPMKKFCIGLIFLLSTISSGISADTGSSVGVPQNSPLSEATEDCLGCHEDETPGIVADWLASRHARVSVASALKKPVVSRRVSAVSVPDSLST
ncbi:MAG: hypothetical protein HOE30_04435, partial [Deltaproteobacteria bacterium]|nr:hypothetical protein [Deltaproteobacteria bacterium]